MTTTTRRRMRSASISLGITAVMASSLTGCASSADYAAVCVDPDTEERSVQPTLEQYLTVITKGGGTVESLDIWGRRRLAYEIQKKAEGIYAVITMKANPVDVKELDRQFSINESIMRTKVIRPDQR